MADQRMPNYPEPVADPSLHPTGCVLCKVTDEPHKWTPPTTPVVKGRHAAETEVKVLLCHDGFHREFWRATCPCGWRGAWRMWASQAREDAADHV